VASRETLPDAGSTPAASTIHVALARFGTCSRTGERLANPGSTARLIPHSLTLPRREPPPSITSGDYSRREGTRTARRIRLLPSVGDFARREHSDAVPRVVSYSGDSFTGKGLLTYPLTWRRRCTPAPAACASACSAGGRSATSAATFLNRSLRRLRTPRTLVRAPRKGFPAVRVVFDRNATKFREVHRAKRLALREPERSAGIRRAVEAAPGRVARRCAQRAQIPSKRRRR